MRELYCAMMRTGLGTLGGSPEPRYYGHCAPLQQLQVPAAASGRVASGSPGTHAAPYDACKAKDEV